MTSLPFFGNEISNAFRFGNPPTEQSIYRGYTLGVRKHPSGWQISITPIRPELPILAYSQVTISDPRKAEAFAAAMRRIDLLLSA
jgi:hypothetical protein